jgi:hypothetical protein
MNNILVFRLEYSCFIIGAIYMRLARGVEDYYEISRIALLCSEQWCREVDRQLRSMASFKISGHTGLLHRWARGPSVQQTWRRIAASIGQGPVGAADLVTHRLFVAT